MNVDYIIVQAGGKGSRMASLTRNKPKALVPINNLPMIFHLFGKFTDKKFIIIGDYKYEVLECYLKEFATVDYSLVRGTGKTGTCAGLSDALSLVPENTHFMLIWSDLVLPKEYMLPEKDENYIGISKSFPCRWKYENNGFEEETSSEFGVAGFFIFKDKSYIADIPSEGEFVRWLKDKKIKFVEQPLYKTHEYGLKTEWDKIPKQKCRSFNKIKIEGDKCYKFGIDGLGKKLAIRESAWYEKVQGKSFTNIPVIYEYMPLCMELIDGKNIYEYTDVPLDRKKDILRQIICCLQQVHNLESCLSDKDSFYDAYIGKTFDRLKRVRNLVPFANDEYVIVNGKKCRNVFFHREEFEKAVMEYFPSEFKLIHGDCTFSNIMLKNDSIPVLIDPRGYFGTTEFYGDVAYDWVKLYYSIVSNYDQFNLKRFELEISEREVNLKIQSNGWEQLEDIFFDLLSNEVSKQQMKLLLSIIWLSLTTYAWEDYDSICGAFYNGLYYLEESL